MARELLGKLVVRRLPGGIAAVRLTEVEAYLGIADPAAHTYRGRRTPRVATMWGEAGHLYVYFVYGMHFCCNVVTRPPGEPEAILLRGARVTAGGAVLAPRRGGRPWGPRISGPANLCRALAIDRGLDGHDLTASGDLWLADDGGSVDPAAVLSGPRVGVAYAGEAADWPLRFRAPD